jgi:Flp pilus assembly protein TadG
MDSTVIADTPSMPRPSEASRSRARGAALIEFALVLPFLFVLTMCVIDVSRAFWIKNVAYQAAREGARYLVVHTVADADSVRSRVANVVSSANVTLQSCTITDLGGSQLKVTVQCQFNWLYPGLFNWLGAAYTNPVTLTGATVMRKEG